MHKEKGFAMESWTESAEVFTKPEVANYMLSELKRAVGFKYWFKQKVLEPSSGRGAFVLVLIDLLIDERERGLFSWDDIVLDDFLRAVDISKQSVEFLKQATIEKLLSGGCLLDRAASLVDKWFVCADFLFYEFNIKFDVVVGNPPYIRFDDIPSDVRSVYQRMYKTFSERCDIYVPFIEKSLSLLSERGAFSFICANRYAKNRYGRELRRFISKNFHVRLYLNVEHADAFLQKVSAYPAIIIIDKRQGDPTYAGELSDITRLPQYRTRPLQDLCEFEAWYTGDETWLSTNKDELDSWRKVSKRFPKLEDSATDTKVGIGVATGADKIYLLPRESDIEPGSKLPVVRAEDICPGYINWDGAYLLNPYDSSDNKKMRDLNQFPKTKKYIMQFEDRLKNRHCAKHHPDEWWRTIDRISYKVLRSPKVLIPDIQPGGVAALDLEGKFYPHHNVYFVISEGWNMKALCTLMRSEFVASQIRKVSVAMRGGSIRYQSQNLREIHVPRYSDLTSEEVHEWSELFDSDSSEIIDTAVRKAVSRIVSKG